MPRSKIEWTDYTINPIKGKCPVACSYCYARKIYDRFKWNPEIRFDGNALVDFPSNPSRIFVGSTMELFGDWIKPDWMEQIMALPQNFPQHTFIFLTKQPQNLVKFSPFPDNCWVGVTATNNETYYKAMRFLADRDYWFNRPPNSVEAKVKFLSFEPLLGKIHLDTKYGFPLNLKKSGINWLVIGAQTRPTVYPKIEWVREIVEAADKAGIPVFLKDNLLPLLGGYPIPKANMWAYKFKAGRFNLRQEMPEEET